MKRIAGRHGASALSLAVLISVTGCADPTAVRNGAAPEPEARLRGVVTSMGFPTTENLELRGGRRRPEHWDDVTVVPPRSVDVPAISTNDVLA